MGLVNEVVNGSVLEQRLEERIADLCEMDPPALTAQKDIIHKWLTSDLETAMQYSILAMKPCEGSEAQRNRMRQALDIKETDGD